MHSRDLLAVAETLVTRSTGSGDAYLRRAQSSIYYAMFHCLARACADAVIGEDVAARSNKAWYQISRALEHRQVASRCEDRRIMQQCPQALQDIAVQSRAFQHKRELADYDAAPQSTIASAVAGDIAVSEDMISIFEAVPEKDRRAFCAYVLFKQRNAR